MHKPQRVTGRVGRPRTIWEAKGISTYHIEPEGELGEILYGRMRNLIFRTKAEVIAEIRMSPYLYEQAGLKQVAVAGIKVGMLESTRMIPPRAGLGCSGSRKGRIGNILSGWTRSGFRQSSALWKCSCGPMRQT